jgi:hypothetical protein
LGTDKTIFSTLYDVPGSGRCWAVVSYADELAAEAKPAADNVLEVRDRAVMEPDGMRSWLGVYRDPWFGEITVWERQDRVEFAAAKSPLLQGTVMKAADRLLVDWHDDSVDVDAWLDFSSAPDLTTLLMTKVDAEADFSFDFEDLRFSRTAACP